MDNIRPINNNKNSAGRRRGSMGYQPIMTNGAVHRLLDPMEDDVDDDGDDDDDPRLFRGSSQQPPQHLTTNQRNPPHHQLQNSITEQQYPNQHDRSRSQQQQQHQQHQQHQPSPHQLYRNADEKEDDIDMHPIRPNKRRERPRKFRGDI